MPTPAPALTHLCRFLSSAPPDPNDDIAAATAWPDILTLAQRHGVGPALYYGCVRAGVQAAIPPAALHALRTSYHRNAARNMQMQHELARVLALFEQQRIPVIPLKGAYLAEAVYGSIALRTMQDIDLLVRADDVPQAWAGLERLGYDPMRPVHLEAERAYHFHLPPFVKKNALPLELHWQLTARAAPFAIPINALWERSQPGRIAGFPVRCLAPEDLMLYLCIHLVYAHMFTTGVRSLLDIAALLRRSSLDWHAFQRSASAWHAEKCAYLGLYLVNALLREKIPPERLTALTSPDTLPDALAFAYTQLDSSTHPFTEHVTAFWNAAGWDERFRMLLARLFPAPAEMQRLYPTPPGSQRLACWYWRRFSDLARRYGPLAWRILTRRRATLTTLRRQHQFLNWLKH